MHLHVCDTNRPAWNPPPVNDKFARTHDFILQRPNIFFPSPGTPSLLGSTVVQRGLSDTYNILRRLFLAHPDWRYNKYQYIIGIATVMTYNILQRLINLYTCATCTDFCITNPTGQSIKACLESSFSLLSGVNNSELTSHSLFAASTTRYSSFQINRSWPQTSRTGMMLWLPLQSIIWLISRAPAFPLVRIKPWTSCKETIPQRHERLVKPPERNKIRETDEGTEY